MLNTLAFVLAVATMKEISMSKTAVCSLWSGQALLVRFVGREAQPSRKVSKKGANKHEQNHKTVSPCSTPLCSAKMKCVALLCRLLE